MEKSDIEYHKIKIYTSYSIFWPQYTIKYKNFIVEWLDGYFTIEYYEMVKLSIGYKGQGEEGFIIIIYS